MQLSPDAARWRRAERGRLLELRAAIPAEERVRHARAIAEALDGMLADAGEIVSLYWPIRAEPDLREWMRAAHARGVRIALPVARALGQPLTFREWHPGGRMERGLWKIPFPADGAEVVPTTVLAPVVGFDSGCYRLGYGGGFFDRTLAGYAHKPRVVGVGYPQLRIEGFQPQPHDIPMDFILPGLGPPHKRTG